MPDPELPGRGRECQLLRDLLRDVRMGSSRSLVLRGEAGIGKTALLQYLVASAEHCSVLRAVGVELDMELAYASLHQLCAPLLDLRGALPKPQRQALEVAFGLSAGDTPDRFLVGLAVLSLLAEVSAGGPVLCVIDDAQWLDQTSALTLAFVARRLLAEPVGVVLAVREISDTYHGLADVELEGLRNGDARAVLNSAVQFKLDPQVCDRIIAETRGNPLALLELPRGLSAMDLAGFGTGTISLAPNGIEASFRRRLSALPIATRRLLLIASAEPLGEPALVWRAAELSGVDKDAARAAEEAGLCEFGARVRFRHPLVRAAAYGAASAEERRQAHAAIAEATDARADPDRRAWHRGRASVGPDESVADELERSAARARARGGQAATAVFLERAMDLTLDPGRRAARALAAAEAKYLAGMEEDALRLAAAAERGPLDELSRVCVDVLRGRVAVTQRRGRDAPPPLLRAAERLEGFDRALARDTYRDAFVAALFAGRLAGEVSLPVVAAAIRSAAPSADPPSLTDELLDAAALLVDAGYASGAPALRRALARVVAVRDELEMRWLWFAGRLAHWVWDEMAWDMISARLLERVREEGVLALVPMAAQLRVSWTIFSGELATAAALTVEQDAAHQVIGGEISPGSRIAVAAFYGREDQVVQLDEATTAAAISRGDCAWVVMRHWATAVLRNGLGDYQAAFASAQQGAGYPPDMHMCHWALSELVEAATRCGRSLEAADAVARLAEVAHGSATDSILGSGARARALVAQSADADALYRLALIHLGRSQMRSELARTHLLYGEWLRREGRRREAREHLHNAHDMLGAIGMEAFAERARKELAASGERVHRRSVDTHDELTPQERQIAQLAHDGLANPQIAARMFLSPRTVEWHLSHVYAKLDIRSRRELGGALSRRKPAEETCE